MPESALTGLTGHHWAPARKAAVALELLCGGDAAELARKHGLSQAQLFAWRERFLEGGQAALRTRRGQIELERDRQVRKLERKVGQLILGRARWLAHCVSRERMNKSRAVPSND